jgi:riboflavin biosynthesis pyrimidine reductase
MSAETVERIPTREDEAAAALASAEAVTVLARRMYGGVPRRGGVIHPTAVWHPEGDDGGMDRCYRVLKIETETPRCHHDAFALSLCRARADAIVTTGKNLRAEPTLTHAPLGSPKTREALAAWRRRRGKEGVPVALVLSSGRDLDLDHPLFQESAEAVVFTGEKGVARLKAAAKTRGIRVVSDPFPDIRRAVAWLQRQGHGTISIEAGPSTSVELYKPPLMVEEVLLSVYRGPLAEALRGGEFLPPDRLKQAFPHVSAAYPVVTQDGEWRFYRYG